MYSIIKCYKDISSFKEVLEYIPVQLDKEIKYQQIDDNNELVNCLRKYILENKRDKYIVSLSGGVDSMVIATILSYLQCKVVAIHINYNNRVETKKEVYFLEYWCSLNNIKLYVKNIDIVRGSIKRNLYEIFTRNTRYDFYKEVLNNENSSNEILLGHHKDDIIENIIANVCRGRNLLDLTVIKNKNIVNGIIISRPMIDYYKDIIYNFANTNNVPYFKDTTPSWSVRGKYRNKVQNSLEDTFGKNVKENLISLSKQSDEWNELIMDKLIEPFLKSVKMETNYVEFNVENNLKYPLCFWNLIFAKLFYQYGKNCPSRKGILTFMKSIPGVNTVSLSNSCICKIKNNKVIIHFKD
tara:strand:+ start:128 stop:1189 length:1062 start_codon:yes stop_codon:yes gene_type:complete